MWSKYTDNMKSNIFFPFSFFWIICVQIKKSLTSSFSSFFLHKQFRVYTNVSIHVSNRISRRFKFTSILIYIQNIFKKNKHMIHIEYCIHLYIFIILVYKYYILCLKHFFFLSNNYYHYKI